MMEQREEELLTENNRLLRLILEALDAIRGDLSAMRKALELPVGKTQLPRD